eukprot:g625.t1
MTWTCDQCTYVNEDGHLACGMCGSARPAQVGAIIESAMSSDSLLRNFEVAADVATTLDALAAITAAVGQGTVVDRATVTRIAMAKKEAMADAWTRPMAEALGGVLRAIAAQEAGGGGASSSSCASETKGAEPPAPDIFDGEALLDRLRAVDTEEGVLAIFAEMQRGVELGSLSLSRRTLSGIAMEKKRAWQDRWTRNVAAGLGTLMRAIAIQDGDMPAPAASSASAVAAASAAQPVVPVAPPVSPSAAGSSAPPLAPPFAPVAAPAAADAASSVPVAARAFESQADEMANVLGVPKEDCQRALDAANGDKNVAMSNILGGAAAAGAAAGQREQAERAAAVAAEAERAEEAARARQAEEDAATAAAAAAAAAAAPAPIMPPAMPGSAGPGYPPSQPQPQYPPSQPQQPQYPPSQPQPQYPPSQPQQPQQPAGGEQMMAVVPAGVGPGQQFHVQVPGRGTMAITVPPGVGSGQQFVFQLPPKQPTPQPQQNVCQLTIPQGVRGGQMMQVNVPGRGLMQLQVPAHLVAGQTFTFQYQ